MQAERPDLGRLVEADRALMAELHGLDTERVMRRSTGGGWTCGLLAVAWRDIGRRGGIFGLLQQPLVHGIGVEVGYHLLPDLHDRRIATESAASLLDYGFVGSPHQRVVSLTSPDDTPSQSVGRNKGLRPERDVEFRDMIHGMFTIDRSQYEDQRR
jgi:RimJ/RimL family protein N-acetyltransferase